MQGRVGGADGGFRQTQLATDEIGALGDGSRLVERNLAVAALAAKAAALRDNPNYVSLTAAEKWDGKLPTTFVPGSAVPFVTVPRGSNP